MPASAGAAAAPASGFRKEADDYFDTLRQTEVVMFSSPPHARYTLECKPSTFRVPGERVQEFVLQRFGPCAKPIRVRSFMPVPKMDELRINANPSEILPDNEGRFVMDPDVIYPLFRQVCDTDGIEVSRLDCVEFRDPAIPPGGDPAIPPGGDSALDQHYIPVFLELEDGTHREVEAYSWSSTNYLGTGCCAGFEVALSEDAEMLVVVGEEIVAELTAKDSGCYAFDVDLAFERGISPSAKLILRKGSVERYIAYTYTLAGAA